MGQAFSDGADYTGMVSGTERITLSEAYHKAFVDVNEEGTEAAAATGLVMRATAAHVNPSDVLRGPPFHVRDP